MPLNLAQRRALAGTGEIRRLYIRLFEIRRKICI